MVRFSGGGETITARMIPIPAPWEWDVRRLATSFVLAGRDNNHYEAECRKAARRYVRSYRQHLRKYIHASPLEV
ncbi:DUF2252 family protein [Cyanobium sp. Morenito 9A2]|nr:DUF2252 family protein [Cyanobium sp. Morenito 9A2]